MGLWGKWPTKGRLLFGEIQHIYAIALIGFFEKHERAVRSAFKLILADDIFEPFGR